MDWKEIIEQREYIKLDGEYYKIHNEEISSCNACKYRSGYSCKAGGIEVTYKQITNSMNKVWICFIYQRINLNIKLTQRELLLARTEEQLIVNTYSAKE